MIVEAYVMSHRSVQLLLLQDEHVIQTLSFQAAYETFANGISPWRLDKAFSIL